MNIYLIQYVVADFGSPWPMFQSKIEAPNILLAIASFENMMIVNNEKGEITAVIKIS